MVGILKFLDLVHFFKLLLDSGLATGSWLDWQQIGNWQLAEDPGNLIEGIISKAFFSFPQDHTTDFKLILWTDKSSFITEKKSLFPNLLED